MTTLNHLTDQLDKIYHGPCWVGVSIKQILDGINEQMAIQTIRGQHLTIWQLVHHITVWNDVVIRRLNGEAYIPEPAIDFPEITDTSAASWQAAKDRMLESAEQLRDSISRLDISLLNEPILPDYSSRFNHINGAMLHAMYHAGQIGILKKMLTS